ncbi:MAG: hypothetical protein ABI615_00250 [Chthoniobacterales bacterium]
MGQLNIIPWLRQLSELESKKLKLPKNIPPFADVSRQIESVRAMIPTAILSHHDRIRSRGKPSVAPVTRGHCGACHLVLSRGRLVDLQRNAGALNICDHCGVFIYLVEGEQTDLPIQPPPEVLSARGKTKRLPRTAQRAASKTRKSASSH